jgi:hypothetical protein
VRLHIIASDPDAARPLTSELASVLAVREPRIRLCYERVQRDPTTARSATYGFTINPDGRLSDLALRPGADLHTEVARCAQDVLARLRLKPNPARAPLPLEVVVRFSPPPDAARVIPTPARANPPP